MSSTNRVFVLDKNKKPLMPTRTARARRLLKRGRAVVYRLYPFTIILLDRTYEGCEMQPISLKFDPGSKVTGIALVALFAKGETLIWAANLTHRGELIKERLLKRRHVRRSRRNRKVRYRPARFKNRRRKKGWLPPSLCNDDKGTQDVRDFLAHDPERLEKILSHTMKPLQDAAIMNAIRYRIGDALKSLGVPTSFYTGGRTKMNRIKQGYPKEHWIDAACVGITGQSVKIAENFTPLYIKACGRGNRQKCEMTSNGFPRMKLNKETGKKEPKKPRGAKRVYGFQTGDIVKGTITRGKNKGSYIGRVTIRANGTFELSTKRKAKALKVSPSWKNCILLQHADGYEYSHTPSK